MATFNAIVASATGISLRRAFTYRIFCTTRRHVVSASTASQQARIHGFKDNISCADKPPREEKVIPAFDAEEATRCFKQVR